MDYQEAIEYFEKELKYKKMVLSPLLEGKEAVNEQYIKIAISAMQELEKYKEIENEFKKKTGCGIIMLLIKFLEFVDDIAEFFEYKSLGTLEEVREAVEKQTAISREIIEGKYFCPKCHNLMPYPGYCGCGQRLY